MIPTINPLHQNGCATGRNAGNKMAMITLTEVLIILLGFALPGTYLFFVRRYIRAADRETAEAEANDRKSTRLVA